MDSESLELKAENARLRQRLAEMEERLADTQKLLAEARGEATSRWEAIGRLAPAAKRLRAERDQLKAALQKLLASKTDRSHDTASGIE